MTKTSVAATCKTWWLRQQLARAIHEGFRQQLLSTFDRALGKLAEEFGFFAKGQSILLRNALKTKTRHCAGFCRKGRGFESC